MNYCLNFLATTHVRAAELRARGEHVLAAAFVADERGRGAGLHRTPGLCDRERGRRVQRALPAEHDLFAGEEAAGRGALYARAAAACAGERLRRQWPHGRQRFRVIWSSVIENELKQLH